MGLLTLFSKTEPQLLDLPSGSFTVDREGYILARTVSSEFPDELIAEVARNVVKTFAEASAAQLPLSELIVTYPSLKLTAHELRGGAIIFLTPRSPFAAVNN